MGATTQITQRLNEAIAHHNSGHFDRAEAIYRQLAATALGRHPTVFNLWGQLVEQQGRLDEAVRLYTQACRLDPAAVAPARRLAAVFIALGRPADAETVLNRLLKVVPASAEAWNALGFVAKVRGRLLDAIACHQKAVELAPTNVDGWLHLGLTLGSAGKNYQGLGCFDRALALDGKSAPARYGRAQALHKIYRIEEAVAEYEAVLRLQPQNVEARSYRLFALQNLERSREEMLAEHRAYGRAVHATEASFANHDWRPDRALRVAILSPDLRTHSCAYFLEPLIRHLDRSQFELYLYHDHFVEDAMSARLKSHATVWRNFVGQPSDRVEQIIRADRPDIVIDLNGHIANTVRLPLFARRLAPVQVTYLGYPDTTGVTAMDYRFTDAVADPIGSADPFATEKLVRFAPTAWAYDPPTDAPDVPSLPSTASGAVTFGCFNSPTKFTDSLFLAWSQILRSVAGSRLLLKGRDFDEPQVREELIRRMQRQQVPVDRVDLLPRTRDTAEHLSNYARVDVALDTFPYNGTTTTCEALWMGRPVVTVGGQRHAGRVGISLLTAVGHPEWIGDGVEGYVRHAVALASAPAKLAPISARLREDLRGSVLLDHRAQSERFGRALRDCWNRKRSAGLPDAANARPQAQGVAA